VNASARLLVTGTVFGLLALMVFNAGSTILDSADRFGMLIDPRLMPVIIPVVIAGVAMVALLALVASYRVSRAVRDGSSNQWLLRFEHPEHGSQMASVPWFWAAVFSFPYFVVRRVWIHVLLGVLFIIFTGGIGNLFQAVFANYIIRKHYEKRGYVTVATTPQASANS
jgi:hypothetical protein